MSSHAERDYTKPDSFKPGSFSGSSPGEETESRPRCRLTWKCLIYRVILTMVTAPYRRAFKLYTWKPMSDFRKAYGDRRELIPLIRDWKVDKYAELQSVQVAASVCAGANLATISWTSIPNPLWLSDALWFCSLICSIWAVITSIQTRSILDDIPDREQLTQRLPESELKRMRRVILRYKKTPGLSHCVMLFIWQFPSMTMSYAWCTFLTGLTVYVCTPFIRRREQWDEHYKVAITYLVVFGIGFFTYLFSSIFVYTSERAFLQSAASTRANTDTTDPGFAADPILYDPEYNAYQSSVSVLDRGTVAQPPATPTSERKMAGQGLECIPENSDENPVRRAATLPLPDVTNRTREAEVMARPRSAVHIARPRFLF